MPTATRTASKTITRTTRWKRPYEPHICVPVAAERIVYDLAANGPDAMAATLKAARCGISTYLKRRLADLVAVRVGPRGLDLKYWSGPDADGSPTSVVSGYVEYWLCVDHDAKTAATAAHLRAWAAGVLARTS